jgi:hypothetical protein
MRPFDCADCATREGGVMSKRFHVDGPRRAVYYYDLCSNADFQHRPIPEVDFATFAPLGGPYARDAERVYWNGGNVGEGRVLSTDVEGFELLAGPYARDRQHGFHGGRVISQDGARFTALDERLAKDSEDVFFEGARVEGVEARAFELVGAGYARDARRLFWVGSQGLEPFPSGDAASFQALGDGRRGRDRSHLYFKALMTARSRHDELCEPLDTERWALDRLVALGRDRLIALAVMAIHQHTACSPDGAREVRVSPFHPDRFERVRVLTQETGSLVVIFDMPIRFVPAGTSFTYSRGEALRLVRSASFPFERSENRRRGRLRHGGEFQPDERATELSERVLEALQLKRGDLGPSDILTIHDGERHLEVELAQEQQGRRFRLVLSSGVLNDLGPSRATTYPCRGVREVK